HPVCCCASVRAMNPGCRHSGPARSERAHRRRFAPTESDLPSTATIAKEVFSMPRHLGDRADGVDRPARLACARSQVGDCSVRPRETSTRVVCDERSVALLALLAALVLSGSPFTLSSSAFTSGAAIPKKYTCDRGLGAQPVSPPLRWPAGPDGTRAFAIRVYDTDAHFLHWLGGGGSGTAPGLKGGPRPAGEGPHTLRNP